jgi:hypothetical protein
MADAAPAAVGFWRKWRHGIVLSLCMLAAVYLLTRLHGLALEMCRWATGDAGGEASRLVLAILLVGIYVLIAPVLVYRLIGEVPPPSVQDHIQHLFGKLRTQQEQHEAALDRLAAKVGLDWQVSAIGRIRLLVRQGRDREATELYQQESGLSGWEAGEAIKAWDAKVAEAKLHLLLRHLDRLAGGGVPT